MCRSYRRPPYRFPSRWAFLRAQSCLALLLLGLVTPLRAQFMVGGARGSAVAQATTALLGDAWGEGNPASWASLLAPTVALFVSQAYLLPALRVVSLHGVVPVRSVKAALGVRRFGDEAYQHFTLRAGLARIMHPGTTRPLYLGVEVDVHHVGIVGYGSARGVGMSLGLLAPVVPRLVLGFKAGALVQPRLTRHETLPRSLAIGLSLCPAPRSQVMVSLFKEGAFPFSLRLGAELTPHPALTLRTGITTSPYRFTAGIGLVTASIRVDLATAFHPILGLSPAFSLTWR